LTQPSFVTFGQARQTAGHPLPFHPVDRGKLLLARTRELIELRGKVRELEHECNAIIQSLLEGQG
jgi:hypothetical protein